MASSVENKNDGFEDNEEWVPLNPQNDHNTNNNNSSSRNNTATINPRSNRNATDASSSSFRYPNTNPSRTTRNHDDTRRYDTNSTPNFNRTPADEQTSRRSSRATAGGGNGDDDGDGDGNSPPGGSNNAASMRRLQEKLMKRPLSQFGIRFVIHFVREFWGYHYLLRLGIVLIALSILSYLLSLAYLLFFTFCNLPRIILTAAILSILSYIYIFQIDYEGTMRRWNSIQRFFTGSSGGDDGDDDNGGIGGAILNAMFVLLESINGRELRWILFVLTMVLPRILEMWTITFLAQIVSESGFDYRSSSVSPSGGDVLMTYSSCWKLLLLECIILIPIHFHIRWGVMDEEHRGGNNNNNGGRGEDDRRRPPTLYLWGNITITKKHTTTLFEYRIHAWIYLYISALLVATFMITSGRYLNLHRPILLGGPFLLAAGFVLLLTCCQQKDENNETVWSILVRRSIRLALIDVLETVGEDVAEDEMLKLAMLRWIVDYWASLPRAASSVDNNDDNSPSSNIPARNTAANENNATSSTENATEGGIGWRSLATMLAMTTAQMQSEVHRGQNNSQNNQNSSVDNLQSMLSSLDVDDRAKPAVQAYKQAVEEFPPSRQVAITVALARRCPAMISVLLYYFFGSIYYLHITITLVPIIFLEMMRVKQWSDSCQYALASSDLSEDENDDSPSLWIPKNMDPMDILLSEDDYSEQNRGSLLQVWTNVKDSISALESGLTAMRCVQTAQVASDLAFDVMSLAKFASEISEQGVSHGLGILALDIWKYHHYRSETGGEQGHAGTAVNILNNVQIISRNIHAIIEEDNPIINGITTALGRGWLWDRDESDDEGNGDSTEGMEKNEESSPAESSEKVDSTDEETDTLQNNAEEDKDCKEEATADLDEPKVCEKISIDEVHSPTQIKANDNELEKDDVAVAVVDDTLPEPKLENNRSIGVVEDLELDEEPESAQKSTSNNDIDYDSDDGSWTEINPQNSEISNIANSQTSTNVANVGNQPMSSEGENDGTLKTLGAGLAILGTVIGGIALVTNAGQQGERQNDGRGNQARRSTVEIERLDSDEEDN